MRTPEPHPDTIVFFKDQFLPLRDAHVGMLTHALNYGTGVFEGIRAYWDAGAHEMHLVRPIEHYHRWKRNASIIRIHIPQSVTELCDISAELVRRNGFQTDLYFRPLAFKAAARIGVHADEHDAIAIAAVPFGVYIDSARGISAGVSSWRRIEDSAIPGRAKICGAYVNSTLATDEARRNGFDEAIFLTERGHVAEGATCNLFTVRDGRLITPPPSDNILEGITRASIMELARTELHLEVVERSIERSELYVCEEAFFTGTAVEVAPITSVDHRPVGNGEIGFFTHQLRRLYTDATHGRLDRYRHWVMPAYAIAEAHKAEVHK